MCRDLRARRHGRGTAVARSDARRSCDGRNNCHRAASRWKPALRPMTGGAGLPSVVTRSGYSSQVRKAIETGRQERCSRCRGDRRCGPPANDALCGDQICRAAGHSGVAQRPSRMTGGTDCTAEPHARTAGRIRGGDCAFGRPLAQRVAHTDRRRQTA